MMLPSNADGHRLATDHGCHLLPLAYKAEARIHRMKNGVVDQDLVSADTPTDLMCMICLDSMEDPATLPCGHSGCKGCLERALAACGGKCPVCRTVHRGPLSTNIMLRNLLAVHHVNLVKDATLEAARREIAVLQSELLVAMEPEAEFEPDAEGRAVHELLDAEPFPRTQSQEDQMVTAAIAASLGGNHVVPPATLIPATATNEQIAAAAPRDGPRHKTVLCSNFAARSTCRFGPTCNYAHGAHELRPLTTVGQVPLAPNTGGRAAAGRGTAYVMIDYSNFYWGSKAAADGKTVSLGVLSDVLLQGRSLGRNSTVAGSRPDRSHPLWAEFESLGFAVELEPVRQGGGGESLVDSALHAVILHELSRRRAESAGPQTLVLVTGDGKDNSGRSNFPDCCRAALDRGWRVEVYGWHGTIARSLRDLAAGSADRMTVTCLDRHRERLVVARPAPTNAPPQVGAPPPAAGGRRPCRNGVACTMDGCWFWHPAGHVRPGNPTAPAAAARPANGQRMMGQFQAGGRWSLCQVLSAIPIHGMADHVMVQFDGFPDSVPIPTARLRAL